MCDIPKRKSACHGSTGKWLKPLNLSKYELPLPSSKSYWNGIFNAIEEKHKNVRKSYPSFPFSKPTNVPLKTQLSDDFKFKISPPTPMHKKQKLNVKFCDKYTKSNKNSERKFNDIGQSNKLLLNNLNKPKVDLRTKEQTLDKVKIFPKKSCPRHTTSIPKLPIIPTENKSSCIHRVTKSASASLALTESKVKKSITEAQKLSTASLLPSFAKPVSADSSVGSRKSFEEFPEIKVEKRDYLRVPNLRFVSSHPSFRKLSLVDYCDDDLLDVSVEISEEKVFIDKKEYNSEVKKDLLDNNEDEKFFIKNEEINKVKKIIDCEKKYIYKALDLITKKKHVKLTKEINVDVNNTPILVISKESSDLLDSKLKTKYLNKNIPIPFQDVQKNFEKITIEKLNFDKNKSEKTIKTYSMTINSSSRSTSGLSLDVLASELSIPSVPTLNKIPEAKIFPRKSFDKCHACLYKPFESDIKIKRELPLATLKSIIDEPPTTRIPNSSSSSSLDDNLSFSDSIAENFISIPKIDQSRISEEKKSEIEISSKDYPKVFFDTNLLSPTTTNVSLPKDQSVLLTSRSEYNTKYHHSMSIQSSDRSKTSTPTYQSSDSDDNHVLEDKLPISKFKAPCHAPVVWSPSLEPLKALRLKKATSIKERIATLIAKPSEGSDSDSCDVGKVNGEAQVVKEHEISEKLKKTRKKLVRMKTATENMTVSSVDDSLIKDAKAHKILKRSKTTYDLIRTESDETTSGESEIDEDTSITVKCQERNEKQEKLPYFDVILDNQADSPPPPIMTPDDVLKIINDCLQLHPNNFDPNDLFKKLSDEFQKRIEERCKNANDEDVRYLKLGLQLFRTLIHSKQYLKPPIYPSNLEFSHKQSPQVTPSQLKYLPAKSHEIVSNVLGFPRQYKQDDVDNVNDIVHYSDSDDDSIKSYSMTVHPPTSQNSLERNRKYYYRERINPYAIFLKKPRRKAVIWRPLHEEDLKGYDPEATLEMRAARLLDRICKEFCEWLKQLSSEEQVIDEDTLKDMFEINFTAEACKSMKVIIKEMPTIPVPVANARQCKKASELEATKKQIRQDLKVERRAKQTFAFGRSLPNHLKFVPPKNRLFEKWLDNKFIPHDLDSMDVVWDGIMHLDSVQTFIQYLKDNHKKNNPAILKNLTRRPMTTKA